MNVSINIVGHVCHDIIDTGHKLGGAGSYASLMAHRLGLDVTLMTSYSTDFAYQEVFAPEIKVKHIKSATTTIYHNQEVDGIRHQTLVSRADDLIVDNTFVNDGDLLFLGPIADEVHPRFDKEQYDGLSIGLLQGWMRTAVSPAQVIPKDLEPSLLSYLDIAICSIEDLQQLEKTTLHWLREHHNHLVVTHGKDGAYIYIQGDKYHFPAFSTQPRDTTGAGDIFSLCYAVAYHNTSDIAQAASFAHAGASLSIEGIGTTSLPSEDQIISRQDLYKKNYI